MAQVLYRKYRSRKLSEVVGQDHITSTLAKALKAGKISHAYLFTGPRGVGKTSVARIMAHEINNLPYKHNDSHLDIIEIDAASNRRIDEVRELRDKLHNAPAAAKFKVYIIDEAHMLTREAFNALLKTLEEPPDHVVFILATTEAHKLPETIISRTQRFTFRPIPKTVIQRQLQKIAAAEHLKIDDEALSAIAKHGHGSFRDSISLLDQLSATGKPITSNEVASLLGLPATESIDALANKIFQKDSAGALEILQSLRDQALSPSLIAAQLSNQLRRRLIADGGDERITQLLRELLEIPSATRPFELLELAVIEATLADPAPTYPTDDPNTNSSGTRQDDKTQINSPTPPTAASSPRPLATISHIDPTDWQSVLSAVRQKSSSLYTALRLATPAIIDGRLQLAFQFPLHQKKVSQLANLNLIHQAITETLGSEVEIKTIIDRQLATESIELNQSLAPNVPIDIPPADTEAISSIFGSVEVLES